MICAHCGESAEGMHCGAEPRLDGRYALLRVLGEGGSGTTWYATDQAGHGFAIKEMSLWRARDPKARELIRREARILRELDHPGIPRYQEHFELGAGRSRALYIVQEFVEGETLASELGTKRLSEAEVLDLADEVLSILAYLHALSPPVIHRDVKPANILRRPDGRLALVDFGSVRDALKDSVMGGSTVAGTFGFMAPEQFTGAATPPTDLYGLGATLVAILSRRPPHTLVGANGVLRWQDVVAVRLGTRQLLEGLLHPDPDERPRDASDAAHLVQSARFVAMEPDTGTPDRERLDRQRDSLRPASAVKVAMAPDSEVRRLFEPHDNPELPGKPGFFAPLARVREWARERSRLAAVAAVVLGATVGFLVAEPQGLAGRLNDAEEAPAGWEQVSELYNGNSAVQACLAYHEGLYEGEHDVPALVEVHRDPREFNGVKVVIIARGDPLRRCLERATSEIELPRIKGVYTVEIPLRPEPLAPPDVDAVMDAL